MKKLKSEETREALYKAFFSEWDIKASIARHEREIAAEAIEAGAKRVIKSMPFGHRLAVNILRAFAAATRSGESA